MDYERRILRKSEKVQRKNQGIMNSPEAQGQNKKRLCFLSSHVGYKHVYVQKRVLVVVPTIMYKGEWPDIEYLELYQPFDIVPSNAI